MRYVCLSDTHGQHDQLVGPFAVPDGDVLVHAGDFTARDGLGEHVRFLDWLASLSHPLKVLVAGNHDGQWAGSPGIMREAARDRGLVYVEHASARVELATGEDATVFGSPWTPEFMAWHFIYPRAGERAERLWGAVPEGLDVLVTHGPRHGVRDRVAGGVADGASALVGCEVLGRRLDAMRRPPRLHVFGHIHEAAGVTRLGPPETGTLCVNASVVDERYRVVRAPAVVELEAGGVAHVVEAL